MVSSMRGTPRRVDQSMKLSEGGFIFIQGLIDFAEPLEHD